MPPRKTLQRWNPACELSEADIVRLREVDDSDAADIYDARTRAIEGATRRAFVELGMICLEVSRRELWRRLTVPGDSNYFVSFDAWIYSALKVSRSSAYSAMKLLQLKDVAVKDLLEMPRRNAQHLVEWSAEVHRDPVVIAAAKNGSERELVATVQERYPDEHVEPRRAVLATLSDSSRLAMEECFQVVRWVYDVEQREEVFELLFAYFMDSRCEREGFNDYSNREAYELAKQRGVA
jgi:hypothetical protein